ncbi:hypothetical protein BC936DRAFT_144134 [Jimgerdemannia flammicorona]|uniref:Uncharacterized protein n=1 Tax=Jimgerdemannia flammicorona TaxID=994334 RepID=A0A432ZYJ1_9FUNG|nr:hypothetical protein BC936DRAFT_144134 [Jimgerdemannia flammicorona]
MGSCERPCILSRPACIEICFTKTFICLHCRGVMFFSSQGAKIRLRLIRLLMQVMTIRWRGLQISQELALVPTTLKYSDRLTPPPHATTGLLPSSHDNAGDSADASTLPGYRHLYIPACLAPRPVEHTCQVTSPCWTWPISSTFW